MLRLIPEIPPEVKLELYPPYDADALLSSHGRNTEIADAKELISAIWRLSLRFILVKV